MIESDLLNVLSDSIDRMADGATIGDCLQRHPQFAAALEPLLETGQLVRRAQPSTEEAEQARDRQMPRFEQLLAEAPPVRRPLPLVGLVQWAALLVLVFGLGGALAAEQSLPGDTLYGLKRITENARVSLLPDTAEMFTQRRFDEARQLVNLRREAELALTGEIDELSDMALVMQGLTIRTADTPERAALTPGMRVEIVAQSTVLGELRAQTIRILDVPERLEQPAALITFTPSPTASGTPEPTRQPTRAAAFTPEATAEARAVEATPAVCAATLPDGWIAYTVQSGETLSDLAARTGSSTQALADANCLADSRRIIAGQMLYLPRQPASRPTLTATPQPARLAATPTTATRPDSRGGEQPAQNRRGTPESEGGERGGR